MDPIFSARAQGELDNSQGAARVAQSNGDLSVSRDIAMECIARLLRVSWVVALALLCLLPAAQAQEASVGSGPAFSQQELDQMLAPIALYPDSLLSQLLMAASYPLEVVEAQRWVVANPALTGSAAVQAVEHNSWDPSVKSLVAFPRILQTMGTQLDWTRRLGDAFLGQQQQVIDTVQALRKKAYAAGNLVSGAQSQVSVVDDYITILPTDPQIAYEPYYDPAWVYGAWWWPQYPPMAWAPWPGYAYGTGLGPGLVWGVGVAVAADFLFGAFDWRGRHVTVNYARFHDNRFAHRDAGTGPWEHNPNHRQGVAYSKPPPAGHFAAPLPAPEARRDFRGFEPLPVRPARAGGFALPAPARVRPVVPPPAPAFAAPAVPAHAPKPLVPGTPRPHAFENIGQGRAVRDFSARGQSSVHPLPPPAVLPCPPGGCNPGAGPGHRAPGTDIPRPRH